MPVTADEGGEGEALAEDGGVVEEAPVGRLEAVEAGRDEGGERLRDGQAREVADRVVDAALELEPALGEEHADRLDRVERHAVGARRRSP